MDKDELLLAVIHGHGPNHWRDPEATQTFLLKNVVGKDLHVENKKEFVTSHSGRRLPRPQGDLIAETLQGDPGYLYFAAATYSWYDPKTFGGEAPTRMVHQPKVMRAHAQKQEAIETITAEELKTKVVANAPVTIIDVRSSEGYAASSTTIKGAIHFKLQKTESPAHICTAKRSAARSRDCHLLRLSQRPIEHLGGADSQSQRLQTRESVAGWLARLVKSQWAGRTQVISNG